jgi:hypothetical protein
VEAMAQTSQVSSMLCFSSGASSCSSTIFRTRVP